MLRERVSKNGKLFNDATFKEWKEKRDEFRKKQKADEEAKKKTLTGLQLFKKQSNLFKDDENAGREQIKVDESNQLEGEIKPVKSERENLDDLDGLDDENGKELDGEDGIEEEAEEN